MLNMSQKYYSQAVLLIKARRKVIMKIDLLSFAIALSCSTTYVDTFEKKNYQQPIAPKVKTVPKKLHS